MIKTGVGNRDIMNSHDICNLARQLNIEDGPRILSLAKELDERARNHSRMRYPFENDPIIPHDKYINCDTRFIKDIAFSILSIAHEVID